MKKSQQLYEYIIAELPDVSEDLKERINEAIETVMYGDRWRVGHHVPRNIYRDGEPIAMLADEETARFIVDACNEKEAHR